jgi:predicted peptidase
MPKARASESQSVQQFERTVTRTFGYKYLLALPNGYRETPRKKWPLLFFLHGSGERGDDVWSVADHGPPKLLRGKNLSRRERESAQLLAENFIVVSPQCPKHKWWDTEALLALLDELEAHHRVDRRRVYLTGLSMGGYGAWALGMAFPERFAALAPVCGGGEFSSAYMSSIHKRSDLRRLPVWAFHGAKDETVPVAESERMISMLRHMQVENPQLTVYPEAKHDSWTETYANPELYRWFLRHERPRE